MTLNKFLKYSILIGLFAVPFIPLIVTSSMFFPFITGKNFAFRIIVEIILALWVVLALRDASYRPKKSTILIFFAAFVGVIAVADVLGENFYRSFWSNYERMEGLVALLHLLSYFLVATGMLSSEKLWRKFFYTSFGVNVALIGYSMFQLAGKLPINQGGVRVDATFGNTTYLAAYLLFQIFLIVFFLTRGATENNDEQSKGMSWPLMIGASVAAIILIPAGAPIPIYFLTIFLVLVVDLLLFLTANFWKGRVFLFLLLILDLFVLYNTQTRGTILGLIAGAGLTLLILSVGNWNNKKIRNIAVGSMISLVLLVGLFVTFRDSSFVKNNQTLSRFGSISLTEQTTKSRFMVWNMSLEGFKEHPVLGWGQDNFIVVFSKYYNPKMWSQEPWFDRSHNVFLDWMTAGGIFGILSYLALFGAGLYTLWRAKKFSFSEKSILTGLLGGYFFQNLFVFDNLTSYIMFFSLLGFISVMSREDESVQRETKTDMAPQAMVIGNNASYFVIPVVIVVFAGVLYFANWKPISASSNLILAISSQKEGLSKNLEYFKSVFDKNTFGSGEAREQLIQSAMRLKTVEAPEDIKQKFFDLTKEQMLIQIERSPTDVRYELYFGAFLDGYGMYDEAIQHLARAVELSPKKQMVLFEIGSAHIYKGDPEGGLKYLKAAYESAPEYSEAMMIYTTGLLYAGHDKEAEAILIPVYGSMLIEDDRILSAYNYRGMHDRIIAVRKAQLEKSPGNQQLKLSLAEAYLKSGDRDSTIKELQEIIELNPAFKEQGTYFINEIKAGRNP